MLKIYNLPCVDILFYIAVVVAQSIDYNKENEPAWGSVQGGGNIDWNKAPIGDLGKGRSKFANNSRKLNPNQVKNILI